MLTMLGFFGPALLVTTIVGLSGADNQTIGFSLMGTLILTLVLFEQIVKHQCEKEGISTDGDFQEFDEQGREIDYEGRYASPTTKD